MKTNTQAIITVGLCFLILLVLSMCHAKAQGFAEIGSMQTRVSLPWTENTGQLVTKDVGVVAPFPWGHVTYRHAIIRNLLWTVPVEKEITILETKFEKPFTMEVLWSSNELAITGYFANVRPTVGLLHFQGSVLSIGQSFDKKEIRVEKVQRSTMLMGKISTAYGLSRDSNLNVQVMVAGGGRGTSWEWGLSYVILAPNAAMQVGWVSRKTRFESLDLTIREQGPYARVRVKW